MANHKSALKKSKQDIKRRTRNRSGKSTLKTALKNYRALMVSDVKAAQKELPALMSLIDSSAKKGFIHDNAANRLKSRLSHQTAQPA